MRPCPCSQKWRRALKQYVISDDEFVLLHRPEHPVVNKGETVESLLDYPHISIRDSGFSDDFFDKALLAKALVWQCD